MSSNQVRIFMYILTFVLRNFGVQIVFFLYFSIYASSGESCMGSLGESVAVIVAPPSIDGSSLGGKKDTAYRCRDHKE